MSDSPCCRSAGKSLKGPHGCGDGGWAIGSPEERMGRVTQGGVGTPRFCRGKGKGRRTGSPHSLRAERFLDLSVLPSWDRHKPALGSWSRDTFVSEGTKWAKTGLGELGGMQAASPSTPLPFPFSPRLPPLSPGPLPLCPRWLSHAPCCSFLAQQRPGKGHNRIPFLPFLPDLSRDQPPRGES